MQEYRDEEDKKKTKETNRDYEDLGNKEIERQKNLSG